MTSAAYKKNFANIDFSDLEEVVRKPAPKPKRSSLAAPMIINDNTEVRSMSDGKTYTSKRALRQSYRDQGVIEMGDQRPPPKKKAKPKGVRAAVQKAVAQAGI